MRLKFIKKNVINVPKLKIDAKTSRLPEAMTTMADIAIPAISTVNIGTPPFEILENTLGSTSFRDIENKALEPPIIEARITEVVAKSADMATNSRISKLFVATVRAVSIGAADVPKICQFTKPTAISETPM